MPDHIGLFAVTAGHGVDDARRAAFEAANDDYSAILAKALADRLAEALAERMHERVRRELWGYAPDETLSNEDLVAERYQGIRPAPGYPATPDHLAKRVLFDLLDAEAGAGMQLTESMAMLPAASVSGLYLWHPESHYFGIGRIGPRPARGLRAARRAAAGRGGPLAVPEPRGRRPALTLAGAPRHLIVRPATQRWRDDARSPPDDACMAWNPAGRATGVTPGGDSGCSCAGWVAGRRVVASRGGPAAGRSTDPRREPNSGSRRILRHPMTSSPARRAPPAARLAAALLLALAILPAPQALAASPVATGPARRPAPPNPRAPARPFSINLARDGDYVRQSNFVQCVGASVQMMLNIMEPGADRTRRTQRRLQVHGPRDERPAAGRPHPPGRRRVRLGGRAQHERRRPLRRRRRGHAASEAMRIAARAIVKHKRPVGLLVWQGRHAWVMSGFEATGDPRRGDFRVTKAYILDPLHPHGSAQWGPSPDPGTAIRVRDRRPPVRPAPDATARGTACPG